MKQFYQEEYQQKGLTTEFPQPDELEFLLKNNFKNSTKDFSRVTSLFEALNLSSDARILDYGGNWGYGTYQFKKGGYRTETFEISRPRAEFGQRLGVDILTDWSAVGAGFDAVYSSHVLEHVPNPFQTIKEQLSKTRVGGFVIAHTPNGSSERRKLDFRSFHLHWGKVHPVLLTGDFIQKNFQNHRIYLSTTSAPAQIQAWNQKTSHTDILDKDELFLVIKKTE